MQERRGRKECERRTKEQCEGEKDKHQEELGGYEDEDSWTDSSYELESEYVPSTSDDDSSDNKDCRDCTTILPKNVSNKDETCDTDLDTEESASYEDVGCRLEVKVKTCLKGKKKVGQKTFLCVPQEATE
ncbi:hypothetical protein F7725_018256 [Dissostichus mawsoni]|uniref:Uncharacterized protein n=1 Tax=Dissostichus mawsoni TaxID=36200 RepID=A0A7J5XSL2_DISMA|nr:hypothetical protein F7725_018256 [Dissostichus mawsoni]